MAKLLFLFAILNLAFALTILLVNAQDQSDFISIDCGASRNYTDETTGIKYTLDLYYIETGVNKNISRRFSNGEIAQQYQNVRSFPKGKRNCYTLKPSKGKNNSYLIRASFMYGNYDGLGKFPEFDLYLGVNIWKTVKLEDENSTKTLEIIHVPQSDYIFVCLVKTGSFTPFISVLELRLLNSNTYVSQYGSLELFTRLDCGLMSNQTVRYGQDSFDRIWSPFNSGFWNVINTLQPIDPNIYEPPSVVMSTAVTPRNPNNPLGVSWMVDENGEEIPEFYLYLHFAELEKLNENQTREFNIYLNNTLWFGPLVPDYLSVSTISSRRGQKGSSLQILINRTENSTLPPLLNALEIYSVKNLSDPETDQNDVEAILSIKSVYQVKRSSWQGDPCAPKDYLWGGLNCTYNSGDQPRIISLNLSSIGLRREISPFIAGLTMLEYLDLSNNNISGRVPEFLADLSHLRVLNLKGNNLKGPVPPALLRRKANGLSLIIDDDVLENEMSPEPSPSPPPPSSTNETPWSTRNGTSSPNSHGHSFGKNKFAVSLVSSIGGCLLYFVI